ncbi:ferritin-like domain-containing protein [Flavobacterium sp. JP2137]|uniref:YciE/YciF ferroxidase family protein n=1 Tax=Flavobacterium sp. JP2137 TaxID=3414510 RepID=UPI003D2FD122
MKAVKKQSNSNKGEQEFEKLYHTLLKGIFHTEQAILKALPEMRTHATTQELQEAFEDHEIVTRKQIMRLERIFKTLNIDAKSEKCEIMDTYSKMVQKLLRETKDHSMVRDAGLIVIAQQIEHYEIATYGGLLQFALALNDHKSASLLEESLEEEEQTDMDLTEIAERDINLESAEEEEEEEDDDQEDANDKNDADHKNEGSPYRTDYSGNPADTEDSEKVKKNQKNFEERTATGSPTLKSSAKGAAAISKNKAK